MLIKLIVFTLIAAAAEIAILVIEKHQNGSVKIKEDPMALPYKAYKVTEPDFNYVPGRTTYDEKSKRFVTDWKYEWEYQGKKHSMMFCDDPNNQWAHYLMTFPDEIDITIHRATGKYYVSKVVRAHKRNELATLIASMVISYIITNMFF